MTRDDIIRMARHVGICDGPFEFQMVSPEDLRRFAKLVSAAEREACAKVCDGNPERQRGDGVFVADQESCAAAIRARSTT